MNQSQLIERVSGGELLLVGECRGHRVEEKRYVDKQSGEAQAYLRVVFAN